MWFYGQYVILALWVKAVKEEPAPGKLVSPNIFSYFEIVDGVLRYAMRDYLRLFVVRLDLRFPQRLPSNQIPDNRVMGRFIKSLRSKINHQRERARKRGVRAHATDVRFVWVREFGDVHKRPHYHVMLVVNRDAYRSLGRYDSDDDNLARCIKGAWAAALNLEVAICDGLVNFTSNGQYEIINGNGYQEVLTAMHYLCKDYTKVRDGARNVGYSLARVDLATHSCSVQCLH